MAKTIKRSLVAASFALASISVLAQSLQSPCQEGMALKISPSTGISRCVGLPKANSWGGVGGAAQAVPLSRFKDAAGNFIELSTAERQANYASGGSLFQEAVEQELTMRERVAAMRSAMESRASQSIAPQYWAMPAAQSVPSSVFVPDVFLKPDAGSWAGIGGQPAAVPMSQFKDASGNSIPLSTAERQANYASGGSLFQEALEQEAAMRARVEAMRSGMK